MKRKASHSRAPLGACVAGGYRKEKKETGGGEKKRGRHMTGFLFVRGAAFGNLWKRLSVGGISRRNNVQQPLCQNDRETNTPEIKVPGLSHQHTHTRTHARMDIINTETLSNIMRVQGHLEEHLQFNEETFLFTAN